MNDQRTPCQSDRVDAFLKGNLSDTEIESFEQHLSSCVSCDAELTARTAGESFWSDAKQFLSSSDVLADCQDTDRADLGTCRSEPDADDQSDESVQGRLGFLDPTDDPRMLGRFGGYEISGIVGSGGMGVVMKGWDVSLDRFVAIKVLNPTYTGQSASRKRFAREAQAAAAVLHDNVIAIYGVDQWNDMPYLVMPYIKGESLQQRIDRTAPLSTEDILGISMQIARGLAAAHDLGLVHRDIKPANILMPSSVSRVIITDFGLARTADDASLTRSGVLAGTPQYMSPEQAKGDPVDGRTDLFSLGSIMYAMACGRPPFRSDTPYGVLRKITDEPHRRLRLVREDAPEWLESIVDRLLEKDPALRFQNASEVADLLEDCLAHLRQPTTALLPELASPNRRTRFTPAVLGVMGFTLLILAFAVVQFMPIILGRSTVPPPSAQVTESRQGGSPEPDELSNGPQLSELLPDSPVDAQAASPLTWEFDDSLLDRLETDLSALLHETQTTSFTDLPSKKE